MRSLKPDLNTSQDLTADALSYTTTITKACKLDQILFKASVAITETITITLDSAKGANYDTVLRTINLSASSSYQYKPEGEMNLQAGDEIKIQCTNANVTGTLYVTIKLSELGG
jgi:hypothetical protein